MRHQRVIDQKFDISIILNLHNERKYLRRTMLSLEEAVRFASHHELTIEIVVVLDRPDTETKKWIDRYDFENVFDNHQIVLTDYASVGLARNHGYQLANGEYLCQLDGDDLISYNYIVELYLTARSKGKWAFAFPEFVFGFGSNFHLFKLFDTNKISKLTFFSHHPYIGRVFAHNSVFSAVYNTDVGLNTPFSHEDWHFNCEAISKGYDFYIAKDTIWFYRQKNIGIRVLSDKKNANCIPMSNFFIPSIFTSTCKHDYNQYLEGERKSVSPETIKEEFYSNPSALEQVHAANKIEPNIDIERPNYSHIFSNLDYSSEMGVAYYRVSDQIRNNNFTDVVLLPFLTKGGADKYIIDVLNGLATLDESRRFLVIFGQKFSQHEWVERLPSSTTVLDLYRICQDCENVEETINIITLRLIQATASSAVLHMKSCEYVTSFANRFLHALPENERIFYRFCESRVIRNNMIFTQGYDFDLLSENAEDIDKLITDNHSTAKADIKLIDLFSNKFHPLYAKCAELTTQQEIASKKFTHRLLWASRFDYQKRPELLLILADRLNREMPHIMIDVFGEPILNKFDDSVFKTITNIEYRGRFDGFHSLPFSECDAFIYTTHFDGLPNIVLEALAAGLPVIAPDVDGLGEAVINGKTGFLLQNHADDERLVETYIEAIMQLYDKKTDLDAMRKNGLELIKTRHSKEAYLERLAEIFEVTYPRNLQTNIQVNVK